MIYNKGYDCYLDLNDRGGIDIIYKGEILPQYIGSKCTNKRHPYPLVYVPGHGEACVHRMVAYCFGILTNSKQMIDHIDNNPYDCRPGNLRICNNKTNAEYKKTQQDRNPTNMKIWEKQWRAANKTI